HPQPLSPAGARGVKRPPVDSPAPAHYPDFFRSHRQSGKVPARVSMVRKKLGRGRKNRCRFCTKEGCPRPVFVDYKDVQGLKKLSTSQGKRFSRKPSGNCAAFQRAVKDAVKRARFMALLPYVGE